MATCGRVATWLALKVRNIYDSCVKKNSLRYLVALAGGFQVVYQVAQCAFSRLFAEFQEAPAFREIVDNSPNIVFGVRIDVLDNARCLHARINLLGF